MALRFPVFSRAKRLQKILMLLILPYDLRRPLRHLHIIPPLRPVSIRQKKAYHPLGKYISLQNP